MHQGIPGSSPMPNGMQQQGGVSRTPVPGQGSGMLPQLPGQPFPGQGPGSNSVGQMMMMPQMYNTPGMPPPTGTVSLRWLLLVLMLTFDAQMKQYMPQVGNYHKANIPNAGSPAASGDPATTAFGAPLAPGTSPHMRPTNPPMAPPKPSNTMMPPPSPAAGARPSPAMKHEQSPMLSSSGVSAPGTNPPTPASSMAMKAPSPSQILNGAGAAAMAPPSAAQNGLLPDFGAPLFSAQDFQSTVIGSLEGEDLGDFPFLTGGQDVGFEHDLAQWFHPMDEDTPAMK
jgi:hypothetical protein